MLYRESVFVYWKDRMKQIYFVAKMQSFGLIENYFCGDHDCLWPSVGD